MTGFGKASCEYNGKTIVVELKSLNSKQIDISSRIVPLYREREIEIRNEIAQGLERGKVELLIYMDNGGNTVSSQLNQAVIESYYRQLCKISENLGTKMPENGLGALLRLPEITKTETQELDDAEWAEVRKALQNSLAQLVDFRTQEGKMLENVLLNNIRRIAKLLEEVPQYEAERIERIRSKMSESLKQVAEKIEYDKNRFEQELIFYIEKLDINEEKTRLKNHLDYFVQTMNEEHSQGKKLGFIAQEIGREINTLGSKANHSELQRIVVMMKDELEQIKEQLLNVN
jgi:uncharacterized protein (TIGR00255 family)